MATYEEVQAEVRAMVKEIDLAIALASLYRRFNEDDRISETFNNTYEAHPFVLCRSSVEYSLALALARCHDNRADSHGLTGFFSMIVDGTTHANLREGILNRRRNHVGEDEAQQDTAEHMEQIDTARTLQTTLRGSHQYGRVKTFRHEHVAHRARNTTNVKPAQIEYFYELTNRSMKIVQLLCHAVLGTSEDFDGGAEIWDSYVRLFFDSMMERAGV